MKNKLTSKRTVLSMLIASAMFYGGAVQAAAYTCDFENTVSSTSGKCRATATDKTIELTLNNGEKFSFTGYKETGQSGGSNTGLANMIGTAITTNPSGMFSAKNHSLTVNGKLAGTNVVAGAPSIGAIGYGGVRTTTKTSYILSLGGNYTSENNTVTISEETLIPGVVGGFHVQTGGVGIEGKEGGNWSLNNNKATVYGYTGYSALNTTYSRNTISGASVIITSGDQGAYRIFGNINIGANGNEANLIGKKDGSRNGSGPGQTQGAVVGMLGSFIQVGKVDEQTSFSFKADGNKVNILDNANVKIKKDSLGANLYYGGSKGVETGNSAVVGAFGNIGTVVDSKITFDLKETEINVADSMVTGDIVGVEGHLGAITGTSSLTSKLDTNNITINNSDIIGDIYGAKFVAHGAEYINTEVTSKDNVISIIDNSIINGDIYGAYADLNSVKEIKGDSSLNFTNNAVVLTGDVQKEFGKIYGGYVDADHEVLKAAVDNGSKIDLFTGNTLNVSTVDTFKVKELGNFETIAFRITDNNKRNVFKLLNTDEAFITAEDFFITGEGNKTKAIVLNTLIRADGNGGRELKEGDEFVLFHANNSYYLDADGNRIDAKFTDMVELDDGSTKQDIKLVTGLIYKTDAELTVKDKKKTEQDLGDAINSDEITETDSGQIVVTIKGKSPEEGGEGGEGNGGGEEVDGGSFERAKGLYQGRLAQLANTSNGAGLLVNVLHEYKPHEDRRWTPIATTGLALNKYNSGPDIRATEFHGLVGSLYQIEKWTVGPFLEYGHSNYTTHGNFDGDSLYGAGSSHYYGVGALAKYTEEDKYYYDASLRVGKTQLDYRTSDITLDHADVDYTTKATYWGFHVGAARILPVDDKNSFDIGVNFMYTDVLSDNVSILGSDVRFDRMQSARLQFHPQYFYQADENATVLMGLGYEYELNGKSKGNIDGLSLEADSIKGGTVFGELGLKWAASDDADSFIGLKGTGYMGKRSGGTAQIFAQYKF